MNTSTRTSRHSFLLLLPVLIALSGSLLAQPVVTSLSFTPAAVNTAGTSAPVTVNYSLTGQGVYYFATAFADPSGNFIGHQIDKQFPPTNSITDSVVITLPPFSPPGNWSIAYIFVLDVNGFYYLPDPGSVSAAFPALGTLAVTSTLDTTPPNLTSFTVTPAAIDTTATSAAVTVGFVLTDDLSGANSFQILFTSPSGNSTQLGSKTFTPSTSVTDSLMVTFPRFSESGTWTVSAAIVGDAAGNTQILDASALAALGPSTLTVTSGPQDTTPPTLTAFSFTPTSINVTGAPATVTLNFTMTDDIAGATDLQATFLSPSGAVFVNAAANFPSSLSVTGSASATFAKGSENGTWTVATVLVGDAAGNTKVLATADLIALGFPTTLNVINATGDTTPPVIVPTVNPLPNGFGWNTTVPVTITWSVTDPESGINSSTGCGTTTVSGETAGMTFTCSATNNNALTASVSVTVRVDLSPPIIMPSVTPAPNGAGWNNTNATVTWTVSDSISGIDVSSESGCGATALTAETAGTTVTCMATNGAGLTSSASVIVKIDKTPPTAAAMAAPAPNGAGWNNTNVTVSFAGADALSGIAGCTAPITISTEGAGQSASGVCVDNAGNTSAVATAAGINIDKTPPVVSNLLATPSTFYINNTTSLTATITDPLSGVASAAYNIDGGSFSPMSGTFGGSTVNVSATTPAFTTTGVHNLCVAATDIAGNTGAPTCVAIHVFTAAAPASGTTCNGAYNGTFNGTIVVSNGQVCDFEGTVTGSIQQHSGTLILLNASIGGSVQVVSGGSFTITSSTINGSLQVVSLPTGTTVNEVCGTHIKGSVQVTSNAAPVNIGQASSCAGNTIDNSLQVQSNTAQTQLIGNHVGGSLQDNSNNTTATPATQVTNNTITSALQCSGNSSIAGGGNTASVKQGQCSAF
jgi:hypothetical protein